MYIILTHNDQPFCILGQKYKKYLVFPIEFRTFAQNNPIKMKKQLIILALMFLMGAGALEAQNSVIDNIMTRTSIRKFKPQAVYIMPLCTVIIGYPDEQPTPKNKWNPENVSYNKFGSRK